MKWTEQLIQTNAGKRIAICPIIVSASRSTDIPAFYVKWFLNRIKAGYTKWLNPFNPNSSKYISFSKTRVFIFWTKNPQPFLKCLPELDNAGLVYYFLYTLNDYDNENLEPYAPFLEKRINTFKTLSKLIGREKLIWRFDPLILTDTITVDVLLDRIKNIANRLLGFTERLVVSFVDITKYKKVQNNLKRAGVKAKEFSLDEKLYFARELYMLNNNWGFDLFTCAEEIPLEEFGIQHNKCIDNELLVKLFPEDKTLMEFLYNDTNLLTSLKNLKDKGQRKHCKCIPSKDIGQYNTCPHLCVYCYANSSPVIVERNFRNHTEFSETI